MNLKNKVIIVVGACGRLGKSLVKSLLAQDAIVIATDFNQEELAKNINADNLNYLHMDMTNKQSILNVFEYTISNYGKIDGAINTAYPRNKNYGKHFLDVTFDDFSENLSLHLGGYFLFMQQCVSYCQNHSMDFSLVNISSIYGVIAPKFEIYDSTRMTTPVEYAAIKSGLIHLAKYVSAYTKHSNFRVNTVSPGGIFDNQPEPFVEKYTQFCQTKGLLNPEDITQTVLFLLSEASKYICGQNIIIDDGFTL